MLVLHAHASQMGLLTAAGLVPSLVLSLHAGTWVDRWGRRRLVMLISDVARALLLLTIPAAYFAHTLTLAHLYVVALAIGIFARAQGGSLRTRVPLMHLWRSVVGVASLVVGSLVVDVLPAEGGLLGVAGGVLVVEVGAGVEVVVGGFVAWVFEADGSTPSPLPSPTWKEKEPLTGCPSLLVTL